MKKLVVAALLGLGFGVGGHPGYSDEGLPETMERYLGKARGVLNQLALGNPNRDIINEEITAMIDLAKPVLRAYAGVRPQCQQQLERVIELLPEVETWSPQEIRKQIEAAQGLPQAEGCYPARDIIAHPAIVRAIVRQGIDPSRQGRLAREMDEAIEHMEEIRHLLQ
jgi:hypothetical protein